MVWSNRVLVLALALTACALGDEESVSSGLSAGGSLSATESSGETTSTGGASATLPSGGPSGGSESDTQTPPGCGDGVVEGAEVCDDGPFTGSGYGWCDATCSGVLSTSPNAIYVATSGDDQNPGTRDAPLRTISAGIVKASATDADVYVAKGVYAEVATVKLSEGVSVFGGFDEDDAWSRSPDNLTRVEIAAATGVRADDLVMTTVLDLLTIAGADAGAGASAYGVQSSASDGLVIAHATIEAGRGGEGSTGDASPGSAASGGSGSPGQPGCEDSTGLCSTCSKPQGGGGGSSSCGATGGSGGLPGNGPASGSPGGPGGGGSAGGSGAPSGKGDWNPPQAHWGQDGGSGGAGSNGSAGAPSYAAAGYLPTPGSDGGDGENGKGGGGGGGGGGGETLCDSYGGGGGGGGGGGCSGLGGGGGGGGGASIAIFLWGSAATITETELRTGGGGSGGKAGSGQPGGKGGDGGHGALAGAGNNYGGSAEQDDGSNGGRGGKGGDGGSGGHGGGGAGGPSIGVLLGGGSAPTLEAITFQLGAAGVAGSSPGNAGPPGAMAETLAP